MSPPAMLVENTPLVMKWTVGSFVILFERLPRLQICDEFVVLGTEKMRLPTPRHPEHRAEAGRQMPEPGGVALPQQSQNRVVNRPGKRDTIMAGQPAGNRRLLMHPRRLDLVADIQEMDGGPAPLLDKAPEGLHVIMMHASASDPQPLPLSLLHQVERHMRVLKVLIGLDCFQIRLAEEETVGPERIGVGMARQRPTLDFALLAGKDRLDAQQPANRVTDVHSMR